MDFFFAKFEQAKNAMEIRWRFEDSAGGERTLFLIDSSGPSVLTIIDEDKAAAFKDFLETMGVSCVEAPDGTNVVWPDELVGDSEDREYAAEHHLGLSRFVSEQR